MYGIEGNFVNTCNGYCEGSISVTASDGNSPYQYIDIPILITDIYGKDILQSKHIPSDSNNEGLIELNCQDFVAGTYNI